MWEIIHTEELRADRTLSVYHRESENGDHFVLFETNIDGLYISYYGDARDAITAENRLTQICYGWDVLLAEQPDSKVRDALFAAALNNSLGDDGCAHEYTCDQVHHAAQVLLGNDDCDGCEVCTWAAEPLSIPAAYLA